MSIGVKRIRDGYSSAVRIEFFKGVKYIFVYSMM